MTPIQAVLFDYGMVLSGPPDPVAWARMRTISNLDEQQLHSGYWAHRHPYDRGDLTALAYWNQVGQDSGLQLTPEQVDALIHADADLWSQLNLPMIHWAQALQNARIRTGILSNIGDAMAVGILARHPWLSRFDHCTWSYALNLAKPEPAIYRHAAQSLNTPLTHILFIDDRADNIQAALDTGMQAIQYTDQPAFQRQMIIRNLQYLLNPVPSGQSNSTNSQNGKI